MVIFQPTAAITRSGSVVTTIRKTVGPISRPTHIKAISIQATVGTALNKAFTGLTVKRSVGSAR